MDSLPMEMIVKVFSYLSGEDVTRMKRLGVFFKRIIEENPLKIRRPQLHAISLAGKYIIDTTIRTSKGEFSCCIRTYSAIGAEPVYVTKPHRDSKFFLPWKAHGDPNDVTAFFVWLFSKGHFLLLDFRNEIEPKVLEFMKGGIIQNNTVIRRTNIGEEFLEICDLYQLKEFLTVIVESNNYSKAKTSIVLQQPYYRLRFVESTINKMICLNESFTDSFTSIRSDELRDVMAKIVKFWKSHPEKNLPLKLWIKNTNLYSFGFPKLDDDIISDMSKEFRNYKLPKNLPKNIRFWSENCPSILVFNFVKIEKGSIIAFLTINCEKKK